MGPLVLSVITHEMLSHVVITLLDTKMSLFGVWQELRDADAGFSISEISAQEYWPRSPIATRKCIPGVHQDVTQALHIPCCISHSVSFKCGEGEYLQENKAGQHIAVDPRDYFIQTFSSTLLSPCPCFPLCLCGVNH